MWVADLLAAMTLDAIRAFEQGAERSELFPNAHTVADGLRVPKAIGDFLVLRAVRASGGTALAVSDADMVRDMREMGSKEGISAAPEGGAALSALKVLLARGDVKSTDTVVLFNTGSGLKYLEAWRASARRRSGALAATAARGASS